jgi:hypothetical protein
MASAPATGDLRAMYAINETNGRIRDPRPPYGRRWPDEEAFPAEGALRDLKRVPEPELPHVLARYVVLRYWLLASGPAPAPLLDHAREAAAAHLGLAAADWDEAAPLRRVLDVPAAARPAILEVAELAEAAGHPYGAYTALRSAYVVARRRLDLSGAAEVAGRLAAFTGRNGDPRAARRWTRRARRLARASKDLLPPSSS